MGFVVIEGLDGSGKSTQLDMLRKQLETEGVPYRFLHFPRLEEGIYGKLIARFLRGEMGAIEQVDPYLVALIFAGDRADAAVRIQHWIKEGTLVIADRYVYSNIAFQCAKIEARDDRNHLRDWILDLEYQHHRIPRPSQNIFLDVPLTFTRKQLSVRRTGEDREYLKGEMDIHESNLDFQERVREEYLRLREKVSDIEIIDCSDSSGQMRSPASISEGLVDLIKMHLK